MCRSLSQLCPEATFLPRDTRDAPLAFRRISRCNLRGRYLKETPGEMFPSETAARARTSRLVKCNATAAGETQIQLRAIRCRRPHIAIAKTNHRNRPRKGSFCNSASEDVAREHITCLDCVCDKLIQITAVVRASCGKQSESYSRAIRFTF